MANPEKSMSPVNRRITWLILVFVFLSLAGSVLPLVSGIGDLLPLPLMARDSALGLHTLVLMAYMAFVFPLSILAPEGDLQARERRRWDLAWWWVGGFILAFSGLPLFVLAYIAGVQVKAVIVVLAWAGVFHGLAILWTRIFGYRSRSVLVALNFLLAVPVTALDYFGARLGQPLDWWSPFAEVRAMTLDFAEPRMVLPLATLAAVSLAVFMPARVGKTPLLATSLLAALALSLAAGQTPTGASARLPAGEFFVPGRALPIELIAAPGERLEVEVADRETIHWAPRAGEHGRRHLHPLILQSGERVVVRDGQGRTLVDQGLAALPADRRLVMAVGESGLDWPESAVVVRLSADALDESSAGYAPYSAVVLGPGVEARLGRAQSRALLDHVAEGGLLLTPRGEGGAEGGYGRGLRRHHDGAWPADLELPGRALPATESNLYSSFALPDWGKVDLRGLVAFIALYHLVFYLIFLLPLLLDARKGLGVYLVSVAFVLVLVVVGAYFVLKEVFLTENQILQQNVGVFAMTDMAGEQPLLLEQATCFASFNGALAEIDLDLTDEPQLVYPPGARGPGPIEIEEGRMRLSELRLDRGASKQMVKMHARVDSPVALVKKGDSYELRNRPEAVDRFGLGSARIVGAFLRRDGRLHEVAVEGRIFRPASEPAALLWHQVVPLELRAEGIPFLTQALGRSAPSSGDVLGVLYRGARLLHDEPDYLQRRDLLQVLFVPLPRE